LEDHADATILRLFPGDVAILDEDLALGRLQKSGDAIEQSGLAAARRAKKNEKLTVIDIEIERGQHVDRAERQRQIPNGNAFIHELTL